MYSMPTTAMPNTTKIQINIIPTAENPTLLAMVSTSTHFAYKYESMKTYKYESKKVDD